jgi:iron complex transport system ATP-binding protein
MSLEIRNLNYNYSTEFSIKNLNVKFEKNMTAVIGPNGAGKSTLIKCISSVCKSDCEILYQNEKINKNDSNFYSKMIGYLPQYSGSVAEISVFEAVLLGLINTLKLNVGSAQIQAVNNIISAFELQELSGRKLSELSGGQLQMVLLAQAIIKQPEILMLDEPLNNLDIHRQFSLLNLISRITRQRKMTTIIVMHDINLAARYADNIVVMHDGKLYSEGGPKEVITEKMLNDIYRIKGNVFTNAMGNPVIEFIDIAGTDAVENKETRRIYEFAKL